MFSNPPHLIICLILTGLSATPACAEPRIPFTDTHAIIKPGILGAPDKLPQIKLPDWSKIRPADLPPAPRTVNIKDFRRLVRADENPPSTYIRTPIANQTAHPDDPTRKSIYLAASNPLFNPATGKTTSPLHYLIEIPIDPAWLTHDNAKVDPATIRAHIDITTTHTSNGEKRITGERTGGLTQLLNGSLVGEDGNLYFSRPYRGPIRFNIKTARFETAPVDLWLWYQKHLGTAAPLHPGARPDFDNMIYNHNGRIFVMFGRYYLRADDVLIAAVLSIPQAHWNDPDRFAEDIRIHAESYPTAPHPLFDHVPDPKDERYKLRVLSGVGDHLLLWSNSFDRLWCIDLDNAGQTKRVVPITPALDGRRITKFHEFAQWQLKDGNPVGAVIRAQCEGDDKTTDAWLALDAADLATTIPTDSFETYDSRMDFTRKQHMEYTRKLGYGESRFRKSNLAREIGAAQPEGFLTITWDAAPAIRAAAERAGPDLVEQMLSFSSGPGFMIAPIPGQSRHIIGAADYPSYYLSRYDIDPAGHVHRTLLRSGASLALVGLGPYAHRWIDPDLYIAGYTGIVRFKLAEHPLVERRQLAGHMQDVESLDNAPAGTIKWFTDVAPGLNGKMLAVGLNKIARGGTPYSAGLRWSSPTDPRPRKWHALAHLARAAIVRNITTRLRTAPDGTRALDILLAGSTDPAMVMPLASDKRPDPPGARVFLYEDRGDTVVDRYSFTLGPNVQPVETALCDDNRHVILLMRDGTLATLNLDTMQFTDALRLPAPPAMTGAQRRAAALMPAPKGGFLITLESDATRYHLVHITVANDGRITCAPTITLVADTDKTFQGAAALATDADGSADLLIGPPAMAGDATLVVIPDVIPPASPTMQKQIGDNTYTLEPILTDNFDNLDHWINVTPNTRWWTEAGQLHGHWGPGGSDLWSKQTFTGDLYVSFNATVLDPDPSWIRPETPAPEGGKNINLRFLVQGPQGADIVDVYRDFSKAGKGPNLVGDDQYLGYFFTFTHTHARLRRSPGYNMVSEDKTAVPQLNKTYHIEALKVGDRLQYFIDGRKIHDYVDPEPHDAGRLGLTLWRSRAVVETFRVYRVLAGR